MSESHATRADPRVVRLQEGGEETPLYFIGAGTDESGLAKLMGQGQAIYGTEVPLPSAWIEAATEAKTSALPTIEELVAPHVAALSAHVRSSSCILAGHSFKGIIAVEAARQLQSRGGRVEAVLLFDTWARLPRFSDLLRYFRRRDWEADPSRSSFFRGFRALYTYSRKSVLVALLVARHAAKSILRVLLGKSKPTVFLDEHGVPIEWEIIRRLQDNIMKTYQPPRTDLRGVLFRAGHENEVIDGILGEDMGWTGAFGEGLKVIAITGNHLTMIRSSEHKKTLAKAIKGVREGVGPTAATLATVVPLLTWIP
jgi:thioesterase domain-containing protein